MAIQLMEQADLGFIQIDVGRVGGISAAHAVATAAAERGVTYVNHTFTSHLALSASLQPYAGLQEHWLCEYPVELQPLARDLTITRIEPNEQGEIVVPDAPGLGIQPDLSALQPYVIDVEIRVRGRTLYRTPALSA